MMNDPNTAIREVDDVRQEALELAEKNGMTYEADQIAAAHGIEEEPILPPDLEELLWSLLPAPTPEHDNISISPGLYPLTEGLGESDWDLLSKEHPNKTSNG